MSTDTSSPVADAYGRLPSGILEGGLASLGSFDECLKIRVGSPELFRGQYCLLALRSPLLADFYDSNLTTTTAHRNQGYEKMYGKPPEWVEDFMERSGLYLSNMLFLAGTCVPSTCAGDDVETMVSHISEKFGFEVATTDCQKEEPVIWSILDIVAISFLALIASLCFLGTAVDILSRYSYENQQCTNCAVFLVTFSVPSNMAKLFGGAGGAKSFACLDGLRVVSFLWIITYHTFAFTDVLPLGLHRNSLNMTKGWISYLRAVICMDGGHIAVDTFFCISGFLLVSTTWKKLEESDGKFNILKFMLNKYFRLTPPLALTMALYVLMYKLGSGPIWNYFVHPDYDNCRTSWWCNLLYINNLFDGKICISTTWYLSALMQFHLIGVVLLCIGYRWPITGIILCSVTVAGTMAYLAWVSIVNNLPLPNVFSLKNYHFYEFFMDKFSTTSYVHLCCYIIGMAFGYIHLKQKAYLETKFQLLGWFLAAIFAAYSVCGRYCFPGSRAAVLLYNVFHRAVWSTSLGWLIHACCSGQGGVVDRLLSWQGFAIFSKLSYLAYLLQVLTIYWEQASRREAITYSDFSLFFEVLGVTAATFIAAAVAYVTVEQPFATLTTRFFKRNPKEDLDETKIQNAGYVGDHVQDDVHLPTSYKQK